MTVSLVPAIHVPLDAQCIHPAVVLGLRGKIAHLFGIDCIVGHDHTPAASRQYLVAVERKAPQVSKGARMSSIAKPGSETHDRVLDDPDASLTADSDKLFQPGGIPEHMHEHYRGDSTPRAMIEATAVSPGTLPLDELERLFKAKLYWSASLTLAKCCSLGGCPRIAKLPFLQNLL